MFARETSNRMRLRGAAAVGAPRALCLLMALWAGDVWAVVIPTVPIGNAGNASDPATGYGAVAYDYRMGITEVTIGQYAEFLNAVAKSDTYELYRGSMAADANVAGIVRSGSDGGYTYSVMGSPDRPIAYVNWGDAARFANWMHNGQPSGLQDASTTEDGAYALNGAVGSAVGNVTRNIGAKWFIPSEDEWYKAAYHKNDGVTANYWLYPTSTNAVPNSDQPPGTDAPTPSNTANFFRRIDGDVGFNDGYAVTGSTVLNAGQNYLTDAAAYGAAASPYGTYDQGGNLFEWNQAAFSMFFMTFRGYRGGAWASPASELASSFRSGNLPVAEAATIGFRLATVAIVPEPGTLLLGTLGMIGLLWCQKRSKSKARPES